MKHFARRVHSSAASAHANVGILGMEIYFPKRFVAQRDLEVFGLMFVQVVLTFD